MKELKFGARTYQGYHNTPDDISAMDQAAEPEAEIWQSSEESLRAQVLGAKLLQRKSADVEL